MLPTGEGGDTFAGVASGVQILRAAVRLVQTVSRSRQLESASAATTAVASARGAAKRKSPKTPGEPAAGATAGASIGRRWGIAGGECVPSPGGGVIDGIRAIGGPTVAAVAPDCTTGSIEGGAPDE